MSRVSKKNLQVNLNLNVRGLEPSATLVINERCRELKALGRKVYNFGLGQSPFPVPEPVVESLREHAHEKDYLPVKGLPALREAIADFTKRTQKIERRPEDILIGPGSKELIFILQLVYYGDLIIPTPSWVSYFPQAYIIGRHVHWVKTKAEDNYRITPEKLELLCRNDPERPRLLILNYPSNPTGSTYPLEKLKQLAQVARKYNVVLVSDEIYGMIHHKGQHVSIARFYPEGTIISSGLSKWCGAGGWRLGTFIFPKELFWLRDAMEIVASETYTSTSAPIQHAAITAFKGGEFIDKYLEDSRAILKYIAKIICNKFTKAGIGLPDVHGGFYVFPDFKNFREKLAQRNILTSKELCSAVLDDTGVAMLPGSDFGHEPEELLARMAYIDFNGAESLKNVDELYQNNNKNKEYFIKKYCPSVLEGVEALVSWVNSL